MLELKLQEKLLSAVRARLDLAGASLSDSYYYSSLSLCVIDSMFSIGVKYTSVKRVVSRVVERIGIEPDRRKQEKDTMPLQKFVEIAKKVGLKALFCNAQRTSPRGGILKSEAAVLAAQALMGVGIQTICDFQHCNDLEKAEKAFRQVTGQKSGISWSYLRMLAGDDNQVKPDRHILRFLKSAMDREVTPFEATKLIQETAEQLSSEFNNMTPRLLDHEIWKYESQAKRQR